MTNETGLVLLGAIVLTGVIVAFAYFMSKSDSKKELEKVSSIFELAEELKEAGHQEKLKKIRREKELENARSGVGTQSDSEEKLKEILERNRGRTK